jgi:hypothetical protein
MGSLSGPERQRRFRVTAKLAYFRAEGDKTEEEIAERIGFGSVDTLPQTP